MKRILPFLLLILYSNYGVGQSYISPSPEAMGLAKLAGVPVNYHTGSMAINIPLAELQGKELNVQVFLNYNASGHKVQDIAGSTGLGWSLNAGGLITRVVRGQADDLADGYCKSTNDSEPDLYFYNFQGKSGKFILDKAGNALTIPYRDIIIKPGICASGSNGVWEIIDENGVKYIFGKSQYYDRETTTVTQISDKKTQSYTSSWMLSEIISANTLEEVTFYYTSTSFKTVNYFFSQQKDPCNKDIIKDLSSNVTLNSKYISRIATVTGAINFSYTHSSRKDLSGGALLNSIEVRNKSQHLKSYKFQYGYFKSGDCSAVECHRLKLEKIYDLAPDPLYSFTYNTIDNLPSRYSKNFDHWGYYNNNSVNNWLAEVSKKELGSFLNSSTTFKPITGASREPDPKKSLANLLTYIDEREGGRQSFKYEAHSSGNTGRNLAVGGARISEVTITDGKRDSLKRFITYSKEASSLSSGFRFKSPKYIVGSINSDGSLSMYKRYSHSFNNVFDLNGGYIGYSRVEERIPGHGKKVYTFTNYDSNPDLIDANKVQYDYSWQRGLLNNLKSFDEKGNIISEQVTSYNFDLSNKKSIQHKSLIYWNWSCRGNNADFIYAYEYASVSRPVILKSQNTIINDPADKSRKMVMVKNYSFDSNGYLIKISEYDNSRPSLKYVSEIKYSSDASYYLDCDKVLDDCLSNCNNIKACEDYCRDQYESCNLSSTAVGVTSAIHFLWKKHIIIPIEKTSWIEKGSTKIFKEAVINTFTILGSSPYQFVVPKEVFRLSKITSSYTPSYVDKYGNFKMTPGFKKLVGFSYNSTTGNLTSEIDFQEISKTYTYGHENTLVTQVQENSGPNTQTVAYTHKPLVGILSTKDPNGRFSYTEYDALNRPKIQKDHNGNIVSRIRYHYKGEKPNFKFTSNKDKALINQSVSFNISEVLVTSGTSVFKRSMGEGTIYNDNGLSTRIAYTRAGTYPVKVLMENSDYSNTEKVIPVNVYNPMVLTTCVNGPISKDLCGTEITYGNCTIEQDRTAPPILTVNFSSGKTGCPGYRYNWQYKHLSTTGPWLSLGNTKEIIFNYTGHYQVKCTVTDACGDQKSIDNIYINYYCSSGEGPGDPIGPVPQEQIIILKSRNK